MTKTEEALQRIEEWLFNNGNDQTVLEIGFWDHVEYNFYALIVSDGDVVTGESTYGAATIEEALTELVEQLANRKGK